MKIIILMVFLFCACNQVTSQKSEVQAIVEANDKPESFIKSTSAPEFIKGSGAEFGLSDLEKTGISNQDQDFEVRVWQFNSYGMPVFQQAGKKRIGVKKSVFVLKNSSGEWSASVFRHLAVKEKKSLSEKYLETKLTEPKIGWNEFWRKIVDEEILTLPNGEDVGVLGGTDTSISSIESKFKGIYRFYEYRGSYHSYDKQEGFKLIREANQIAKINNLIANEFDISDMRIKIPKIEGYKF
jgi:hypothetical protein